MICNFIKSVRKSSSCSPEVYDNLIQEAILMMDKISALETMYAEPVPNPDIERRLRQLCRTYQGNLEAQRNKEKLNNVRILRKDAEHRLNFLHKHGPGHGLREHSPP